MLISKFHHSKIVICQIDTFFEWTYDIEVLDVFDVSERFWSASDMSSTDFRLRRFCQQKNASVTHIGDLFLDNQLIFVGDKSQKHWWI